MSRKSVTLNNRIFEKIAQLEAEGKFDSHLNPVDESVVLPVDENYHYEKPFWEWLKYRIEECFIVIPYVCYINLHMTHTKVSGRENLKGVRSAVVTSNHIYMFDCLAMRYALRGHRLYTVAAPFNNMKGFLGEMMRAGNMIPLGATFGGMRKFNAYVKKLLEKGNYVMIYPEQAMWWMYEKPRPYKKGAYHYAAQHQVPVIPCFITLADGNPDRMTSDGLPVKNFHIHIMPPVYPKPELSIQENIRYLMEENARLTKAKYEEVYQKPLVYAKK